MKTTHVFGSHIYVISNYGVARNPIFEGRGDLKIFEAMTTKYLSPVCDIISCGYSYNQFQFIIRVNPRDKIEEFYFKKYKKKLGSKDFIIPETYLIFSQQVSNLLNAYAKKFNKIHSRRGGLFAARYRKILIESEEELDGWKRNLQESIPMFSFSRRWDLSKKKRWNFKFSEYSEGGCENKLKGNEIRTSLQLIEYQKNDLRGCFECLPPLRVDAPNFAQLYLNFLHKMGFPPPW